MLHFNRTFIYLFYKENNHSCIASWCHESKKESNPVAYLSDSNSPCWSIWTTCLFRRLLRTSGVGFHNVSCCPDCFSCTNTSLSCIEKKSSGVLNLMTPPKQVQYNARLSGQHWEQRTVNIREPHWTLRAKEEADGSFKSFSPAQKGTKFSPSVHQRSPRAPPP